MSANGEAPFFNAPELTQRDGTLSEAPGEMFADPVSGLVTAAPEPRTAVTNGHEPGDIPVAGPVQPDEEVVRRMVEETLREENDAGVRAPVALPPAGTLGEGAEQPLGLLPRQRNRRRTWPTRPPQLMRAVRPDPLAEDDVDDVDLVPVKRRKLPRMPSVSMPAFNRPSSSAAGVMLAVALLIVFGVVAIEMVSSLVSSVTGLFH